MGCCHGNQLKSKNWRFPGTIYFVALPFLNGLQYHNSDFKRLNRMNFSALHTIFSDIRSRNPRVYAINNNTFCGNTAEISISRQISLCPVPILTYFTGLVGVLFGLIIVVFVWQLPKGRCYGKELNLGDVYRHRQERPLLFASAFDNGLADRKPAFKILNSNDPATTREEFATHF